MRRAWLKETLVGITSLTDRLAGITSLTERLAGTASLRECVFFYLCCFQKYLGTHKTVTVTKNALILLVFVSFSMGVLFHSSKKATQYSPPPPLTTPASVRATAIRDINTTAISATIARATTVSSTIGFELQATEKPDDWTTGPETQTQTSSSTHPAKPLSDRLITVQIMDAGENIKVGERTEVHVMNAIRRADYPQIDAMFNIVLLTWSGGRQEDRDKFVCCLSNSPTFTKVVEIPAVKIFEQLGFHGVDMRYVLFACSQTRTSSSQKLADIGYVAFAEHSCEVNMTRSAHKIINPEDGRNKLAVCKTFAYGYLAPDRLVEWFEFARIVGVSVVQIHYHIVNEGAMKVFRYYETQDFVIMAPVMPASRKGHPPRGFQHPRNDSLAWMDKRVILNDCLHRLSGYDYVAVVDFDELLMPALPYRTLHEVLQDASATYPEAGVFLAHSYLNLLEWSDTHNKAAISYLRRLDRTVSDSIDKIRGHRSSPKIIYIPQRIEAVQTHDVTAFRGPYTRENLPRGSYNFRHFRTCKSDVWATCDFEHILDPEMLRFKQKWLQAIVELPLLDLDCSKEYVQNITIELTELKEQT